jgi:hypothetical protein
MLAAVVVGQLLPPLTLTRRDRAARAAGVLAVQEPAVLLLGLLAPQTQAAAVVVRVIQAGLQGHQVTAAQAAPAS